LTDTIQFEGKNRESQDLLGGEVLSCSGNSSINSRYHINMVSPMPFDAELQLCRLTRRTISIIGMIAEQVGRESQSHAEGFDRSFDFISAKFGTLLFLEM
jgi:hypothetical protein